MKNPNLKPLNHSTELVLRMKEIMGAYADYRNPAVGNPAV
jgi:hypothetical protein